MLNKSPFDRARKASAARASETVAVTEVSRADVIALDE